MLKSNPKKKKAESLSKIEKRCDTLVSKIVRMRDDRCVTCGSTGSPQAGHFLSRRFKPTRMDLTNVHRQCSYCNMHLKGNMVEYFIFIQREYGEEKPNQLREKARGKAPGRFELLILEVELKEELRRLDALNE